MVIARKSAFSALPKCTKWKWKQKNKIKSWKKGEKTKC
jgi:hypothetical protein